MLQKVLLFHNGNVIKKIKNVIDFFLLDNVNGIKNIKNIIVLKP